MTLIDTTDGVLMLGAYGWAFMKPIRKLYYNMTITAVSVVVALVVGGIETLDLIGDQLGLTDGGGFWGAIGAINDNFGVLGYVIIGVFRAELARLGHLLQAQALRRTGSFRPAASRASFRRFRLRPGGESERRRLAAWRMRGFGPSSALGNVAGQKSEIMGPSAMIPLAAARLDLRSRLAAISAIGLVFIVTFAGLQSERRREGAPSAVRFKPPTIGRPPALERLTTPISRWSRLTVAGVKARAMPVGLIL